jgi:ribosomal protein S18 acetylase RimI-like enzyme
MFSTITIELVCASDVETLLALSRKTFYDAFQHLNNPDDFEAYTSRAFTYEQILSEINNPDSEFYFAMLGDEAVGYIKLNYRNAQAEFREPGGVEVSRIYILASQQGKRIGNQLLDFAINKAIADHMSYIWLGVWEHNLDAARFYERNGFVKTGSHQFVVGNDVQTDFLMKKELKAVR